MLTNNWYSAASLMLQYTDSTSSGLIGVQNGLLPVTTINGMREYMVSLVRSSPAAFPHITYSVSLSSSAGVHFGTGRTPASLNDYNLENRITTGISPYINKIEFKRDKNIGNTVYIVFNITIANISTDAITINEIGYAQYLTTTKCPEVSGSGSSTPCLLDRTVLDSPLIIQPNDSAIINYKLQTTVAPPKIVSGVEIVSWEFGSDEKVAAMIDAAHNGLIDLQTDGGWRAGDMRIVGIDSYVNGAGTTVAAQNVGLFITSFDNYNNCGNVMQVDFIDCSLTGCRMNSSNTNVGGYGSSEMDTVTLPNLVAAFPDWIKTRFMEFSVLTSEGNRSTTIENVGGNKLALRSEYEIFGSNNYSVPGEGNVITLYSFGDYRKKAIGLQASFGANAVSWWLRSPTVSGAANFCNVNSSGVVSNAGASSSYGVAPFGCL